MRLCAALLVLATLAVAAPAHAQDVGADPTYGSVRLRAGFLPDPHTVSMTAGGSIRVSQRACSYGYVASAPDVELYYTAGGRANLYLYARSGADTTLLVSLPSGRWVCNDDGMEGSRDPFLVIPRAPSGRYSIWVGTYGRRMAPATLYISEVDPR